MRRTDRRRFLLSRPALHRVCCGSSGSADSRPPDFPRVCETPAFPRLVDHRQAVECRDMPTESFNILVVDDDRTTCAYVAKILAERDWQVDTACDGPAALGLVRKKAYDAVVLDYRMPGMDGAELYRRIQEVQPGVPGVFVTGYPSIETVFPAIEAGAHRVLAKPVDPKELVRVVEEQLGGSAPPECPMK